MARRIFVVLSQSPNSSPPRRHLEEELVTQLLMESGIEVNVVPHLADLAGMRPDYSVSRESVVTW
jgi:hypothetical protein